MLRKGTGTTFASLALVLSSAGVPATQATTPLGTAFTYQGQLKQSGSPVTGTANLLFSLWDALAGPNQVGSTQTINGVSVTGGLFTVTLNVGGEFGATPFNGDKRWLEISVNGTTLAPRQELTAAPNAAFAARSAGPASGDLSGTYPNPQLATLASSLTKVSGGAMFTNGGFVGIGTSGGIGPAGFVVSQNTLGFGGMYVNTSSVTGLPFYGYALNNGSGGNAYHYLDGSDGNKWKLFNNGDRLTVTNGGNVGIGTTSPAVKLHLSDFGLAPELRMNGQGSMAADDVWGAISVFQSGSTFLGRTYWKGDDSGRPDWTLDTRVVAGALVVDGDSGNVGIGATSPAVKLHLSDPGHAPEFRMNGDGLMATDDVWGAISVFQSGSTFLGRTYWKGDSIGRPDWTLDTRNVTGALVVDGNSGNVGIGVTTPVNKLDVEGAAAIGATYSGTNAVPANGLIVEGKVGIGTTSPSKELQVEGAGDVEIGLKSTDTNGKLWTIQSSSVTGGANDASFQIVDRTANASRLSINTSGNVGMGRVSTANKLEVEGNASKTAAGSWLMNSDARIKTEVRTVTNALRTLDKVRLVSFRYTDDYRKRHPGAEDRQYLNVIAQEFKEVFPEHVKSSGERLPDGHEILQVDDHPLTIYSAAAVQELHQLVKEKVAEIAIQRKQIAELTTRLERMEVLMARLAQEHSIDDR